MSYILDALKKSERERKQGELPGLNSFPDQPRPPRATRHILLSLGGGFFLCVIMAVGLWAVLSRLPVPAPPARTAPPAADSTPLGAIPPSPPAGAAAPAETAGPADQPKPAISPTAPDNPPPGPAEDLTPAPEAGPAAVAPRPETTAAYPDDAEPPTDDDQDPGGAIPARLTTFANLPAEVRNALPELTIGAHYYAKNPAARMVGINGRIVRQGQTVAPGLILEEITREGVIFSFHNRRFSREVFAR